ncbi:histone-lysine N-methyltransferase EZA1 isoform X2 [Apium graveolens]|uniref:histone-lysine N-methyltransferase EZA1 isoform X2 n=1 Tax=Apium graveolens TaxID=4045 RepID=UPI003D7B0207
MVSKSTSDASSKPKVSDVVASVKHKILKLEKQIQEDRNQYVKELFQTNRQKLDSHVSPVTANGSNYDISLAEKSDLGNMLNERMENPLHIYDGFAQGLGDKDIFSCHDATYLTSAKLPLVEKIPSYTTWIFLDRNQRMAEDQSVVGRRRIYYDQNGSEALLCSDSEEDTPEPDEEKHEFSQAEDHIIWTIAEEHGLSEEVLNVLAQFISGSSSEILERYGVLNEEKQRPNSSSEKTRPVTSMFLEKSLAANLDSMDNLFCRRCLVFDCRLHGCSQGLVNSSEKQPYVAESEDDGKPCSGQCYLQLRIAKDLPDSSLVNSSAKIGSKEDECSDPISLNAGESGKRKSSRQTPEFEESLTNSSNDYQGYNKKQKMLSDPSEIATEAKTCSAEDDRSSIKIADPDIMEIEKDDFGSSTKNTDSTSSSYDLDEASERVGSQTKGIVSSSEWKLLEKELYLKGIEIFGRNSCLIARNLLPGLKTCLEVFTYMNHDVAAMSQGSTNASNSFFDGDGSIDANKLEQGIPARSRLFRRRGKTRKLKYSWKSAGHPSFWRRTADGKNQSCKQYIPCGCDTICGKQCPCHQNGTCCEKYCGCSKSCKNRFRGCHCAKSQCKSRQCPCFAAGRECDPDVCRNCWVSCGDGSLGEPPRRGDGHCGNMRLLLRQQQRILLAKSDVAGWGAFLKNSVNKNDYLGEYTGELISHREADKRGKIYDRANSSFLFDLNEQYVLDAYRKGDKLKFANHSSNPNCYAKVMLVAGDHRVGIFANERIEASEELFYDYRYGPDQAPEWARRPEGWKGDDASVSQGRAKKHQSH